MEDVNSIYFLEDFKLEYSELLPTPLASSLALNQSLQNLETGELFWTKLPLRNANRKLKTLHDVFCFVGFNWEEIKNDCIINAETCI